MKLCLLIMMMVVHDVSDAAITETALAVAKSAGLWDKLYNAFMTFFKFNTINADGMKNQFTELRLAMKGLQNHMEMTEKEMQRKGDYVDSQLRSMQKKIDTMDTEMSNRMSNIEKMLAFTAAVAFVVCMTVFLVISLSCCFIISIKYKTDRTDEKIGILDRKLEKLENLKQN